MIITGSEASSLSPVGLQLGWNLVGVPSSTDIPVTDFDATILVKDFNGFYEFGNVLNSINALEPGKAYFIHK